MENPTIQQKSSPLISAINNVMREVSRVKKTGINSHHRYSYASEEDLIEAIRPAMVSEGLIMIPSKVEILNVADQGKNQRIDISVQYHIHHISGMGMVINVVSSGMDSQDKALPKAMTMALKYAIVQTFLIPRSDNDPDNDKANRTIDGWRCDKAQFIRFANTVPGGSVAIENKCKEEGWPVPEKWNQKRLENFIQLYKSGQIAIGGEG